MRSVRFVLLASLLALLGSQPVQTPSSILIQGGLVVDGSGKPGRLADVRIEDGRIAAIGKLTARPDEKVLDAKGLVVAPGFIDAHSHTNGPMKDSPFLESQVRQGITTAIVGQDGGSAIPISDFFKEVEANRPTINFATFCGHGSLRSKVMGEDYKRAARDSEVEQMKVLLEQAMKDGALGLSSGLEYDPGFYATTPELIELAKVAAKYRGMYISHTRSDGGASDQQSIDELRLIAKEAKLPAQISHIKLAVPEMWKKAPATLRWMAQARREGIDVTADVYPYLYWQSTITVLTSERDSMNRDVWQKTLAEIGADNITLTRYTPDPAWQGKTLTQIAKLAGKSVVDVVVEIVGKTHAPGSKESESIVCRAMSEDDLQAFLNDPFIMFCSDGSHGGSHPRGAGSFPRIFGRYVRELGVLKLEEAVRKAAGLPAWRFGLKDRGELKAGKVADIVVFDPKAIQDRATIENSTAFSEGMVHVIVNGTPVLESGKMTGARPGRGLRRQS